MGCANKNSPEFKKLEKLTGLEPSEISMAIGLWQDHHQTERWPSSAQITAMISNRHTYGGIDQYLKAISKPTTRADVNAAIANLPERVKSIEKALQGTIPGTKFKIHDTQESYEDAIRAAQKGKLSNQTSNAFYNPNTKEIHLNANRMVQTMSRDKKQFLNTAEHEAIHPLLEALETINPGTIGRMFDQLVEIEKAFGLDGKYTKKFASYYAFGERAEEAITEFVADIASGNLDLSKAPKSLREKISAFFAELFAKIGIDIKPYLRTNAEIVKYANDIKALFEGAPSNIKMQKSSLTRTSAFKNWFGDWENDKQKASKVVDENGEPLPVYHGTTNYGGITTFKKGKRGNLGPGIYFTNDLDYAKGYADKRGIGNGHVISSFVKMKNPFYVYGTDGAEALLTKLYSKKIYANRAKKQSNPNYLITQQDIKKIQDLGHDGIIWAVKEGGEYKEYSVFNSSQVKLADGSNTTFSPYSKDIRLQVAPTAISRNGKPLLVYRSQKDDRKQGIERQSGHAGIYFSENKESTKAYGDKTKAYYLDIKNPLILKDKEWNLSVMTKPLMDKLIRDGYDGAVWNRNGEMYEIIAFNEKQIIPQDSPLKYQIIGEQGAANLDKAEEKYHRMNNLDVARKMERAGKSVSEIRYATGWERGANQGKWRYEIPDVTPRKAVNVATFVEASRAQREIDKLNEEADYTTNRDKLIEAVQKLYEEIGADYYMREDALRVQKALRENNKNYLPPNTLLGNIKLFSKIRHDGQAQLIDVIDPDSDLFKSYPDFKYIKVKVEDLSSDKTGETYASWNRKLQEIKISDKLFEDDAMSSLIHEIQHAIQGKEGFEEGTSPSDAIYKENLKKKGFQSQNDLNTAIRALKDKYNEVYRTWERKSFGPRYKGQKAETEKLLREWQQIEKDIEKLSKYEYTDEEAHDLYRKTAGEVEARNAQLRAFLNPTERKKIPLSETEDVSRDDQIFLGIENPASYAANDLVGKTDKHQDMTEAKDNYVFYAYGQVEPGKMHTKPQQFMVNSGNVEYSAAVKKDQVYPFEEDPNNYLKPGPVHAQIDDVIEMAAKDGFKAVVTNGTNKLVAYPTKAIKFQKNETRPEPTKNINLSDLIAAGEKITISNKFDDLQNNKYLVKDNKVRRILSATKVNQLLHKYTWHDVNMPSVIHETTVRGKGKEETTQIENKLKFSLSETDNSENKKSPYEESVAFGRLVTDIAVRLKEGLLDIDDARAMAGVDNDTNEIFNDAFDVAVIRSGFPPSNTRQYALFDLIAQLPKGSERPTAQALYRKRRDMLEALRISPVMLKQILPDEKLYKDKRINQTWKRILYLTNDVGDYVSKTLDRGRKFAITDTEGNESGYWDETALGFSDMLGYVNEAVQADPDNKEKLLSNVRKALKENGDDEMLQLLEVAIAASGKTNMADLSKIVRAGTMSGRILNVIKRYIGSSQFGEVRTDLAAATIIAENDDILAATYVNDESEDKTTVLDLADEIQTILKISAMSDDEREQFIADNPDLISNVDKFLKGLDLSKGGPAPTDKKRLQRGKTRISKGMISLADVLKNKYPEMIKLSKSELDPDVLKSVKQVLRGLIDVHGSDSITLKTELSALFNESNILLDPDVILNDAGIKAYIKNYDQNVIRSGAIESLGASDDTYTKMVIDQVIKSIGSTYNPADKVDALMDALDRGELTKKVLNAVRESIEQIPDDERREKLLAKLDEKFSVIFDSAVSSKVLSDAVSKGLGKITRDIVAAYIADPDKSREVLAARAMQELNMTPAQAAAWADQIDKKVKEKLDKAKKSKIKSILNTKVQSKKKAEELEEKIFTVINTAAEPDGSIPSEAHIDGQMIDIKQVFADKFNVRLNDARMIAKIVKMTNLMRTARTQARKDQLYAQIMLMIKNMKISPNKYVRGLKVGLMETATFVMANILSGINSAYKATIAGFYNSMRAYVEGAIIGKVINWKYGGKINASEVFAKLNESNPKTPASHLALTYRLYWDLMRNGSASISQTNVPEHGLSNFDVLLNENLAFRALYAPFRHLSAIDRATMNLNYNRLARRRAVNALLEFGRNNVTINGQTYSRTAGGAGWYKVDGKNNPEVDPLTGNIITVRDTKFIKTLNEEAKRNLTTTEVLLEAEKQLGLHNINETYQSVMDEWNALVDLAQSTTATPEQKEELKKLGLSGKVFTKVKTMDDFAPMSGNVRRFIAQEIYKKIHEQQNEALDRAVGIESGMYSAQGIEIPGWPAGLLYQAATVIDRSIQSGLESKNGFTRLITYTVVIPAKLYSFLIIKAPSIGYGAALLYSPVSFLLNIANLMAHMAGRPFMRISYDAKEKHWRYNGLTLKDIENATGIKKLSPTEMFHTTNPKILKVLKEGYTVPSQNTNVFNLSQQRINTIGGQGGTAEIGTILARQAISTATFAALVAAMFDCPEGDCEMSPLGKKILEIFRLQGYGAMKDWLYKNDTGLTQYIPGYRPVVDKFGNPQHNSITLSPEMGPFQLRLPVNEMNNAVAITTLTRIVDEMNAGVKITPHDMMVRYMIFSNFDLLQDNMDISVEGLAEFKELILSFFNQDPKTKGRQTQKASSSAAKRLMAALTPKMINEVDKFMLDEQNKNMWSVKKEGFWEQFKKKIPLNVPMWRRYVAENDPETYKALPYKYEWTDWQMYLKAQQEGEEIGPANQGLGETSLQAPEEEPQDIKVSGFKVGKFSMDKTGRKTVKAPDGEVAKIKNAAINAGKGEYKENGYFKVANEFDRLLQEAINASDMESLLSQHKTEEALDLLTELAKETKQNPEFTTFKQENLEKKEPKDK